MSVLYYDNIDDCYYYVPPRCGSSFTKELSDASQGRLTQINFNCLFQKTATGLFAGKKVYIVYRDPLSRYKSGLSLVMPVILQKLNINQNIFAPDHNIQYNTYEIIKNIINGYHQNITTKKEDIDTLRGAICLTQQNSYMFDFTFKDSHCTPVMVLQLFFQSIAEGADISWLNLRDYSAHMKGKLLNTTPELDEKFFSPGEHKTRSVTTGNSDPNVSSAQGEALMSFLCEQYPHYNNTKHKCEMSFWEWMSPDTQIYNFIESNNGVVSNAQAQSFLCSLLRKETYILLRYGDESIESIMTYELYAEMSESLQLSFDEALAKLPKTIFNATHFRTFAETVTDPEVSINIKSFNKDKKACT